MKLLIAGSRDTYPDQLLSNFNTLDNISKKLLMYFKQLNIEVVSGGCRGVDLIGEAWARSNKYPIKQFLPDWKNGKQEGPIRNKLMAEYCDTAIIFKNGKISKGTDNMILNLNLLSKPFYLEEYNRNLTSKPEIKITFHNFK